MARLSTSPNSRSCQPSGRVTWLQLTSSCKSLHAPRARARLGLINQTTSSRRTPAARAFPRTTRFVGCGSRAAFPPRQPATSAAAASDSLRPWTDASLRLPRQRRQQDESAARPADWGSCHPGSPWLTQLSGGHAEVGVESGR